MNWKTYFEDKWEQEFWDTCDSDFEGTLEIPLDWVSSTTATTTSRWEI